MMDLSNAKSNFFEMVSRNAALAGKLARAVDQRQDGNRLLAAAEFAAAEGFAVSTADAAAVLAWLEQQSDERMLTDDELEAAGGVWPGADGRFRR